MKCSKQLFFDYVIFKHYKENPKRIDPKVKKKMIGDITQKQMGIYLKDPKNTFFMQMIFTIKFQKILINAF